HERGERVGDEGDRDARHEAAHRRGDHRFGPVQYEEHDPGDRGGRRDRQRHETAGLPGRQDRRDGGRHHGNGCQQGQEQGGHDAYSSPVGGTLWVSSSRLTTASESMNTVTASVMTIAVRTNAWGSGSADTSTALTSASGSARQAATPALSNVRLTAWLMSARPNTTRTMPRCIIR